MSTETLTIDLLEQHLEPSKRRKSGKGYSFLDHVPRIECKDGFTMSVQASRTHYCSPRLDEGFWSSVEVGYPSEREELLMPYVENAAEPTETVYGYVPICVVAKVIDKHGGFAARTKENKT